MFFNKKKDKSVKCDVCSSKIEDKFSFCPYCGSSLVDLSKVERDYGLLGKTDSKQEIQQDPFAGMGIADKMINTMINSLMKNLEKQMKTMDQPQLDNAEIKQFPNGIRIKISPRATTPQQQERVEKPRAINSEQIKKMETLPRGTAKSKVKRLSNKVVYELNTPGISSLSDIFISKTESGYEIKAIGSKKVYVNSLPIDLQLKSYSIQKDKLLLEFKTEEN